MKILIDTNILISAALSPDSVPGKAFLKAVTYPNKAIICEQNVEELKRIFNRKNGYTRPDGRPFDGLYLNTFMRKNGIKTLKERYLENGWLTLNAAAERLGIPPVLLRMKIYQNNYNGNYIYADGNHFVLMDPETLPVT